jgi:sorting nexin-8
MLTYCTDLPEPSIPYLKKLKTAKVSETLEEPRPQYPVPDPALLESRVSGTPPKSRRLRKDSLEDPESDPWASAALHKGHTHPVQNEATPKSNGVTAARPLPIEQRGTARTTSAYTTRSEDMGSASGDGMGTTRSGMVPPAGGSGGWGSYGNPAGDFPNGDHPGAGPTGFGSGGDDPNNPIPTTSRALGGGRTTSRGVEETITITTLPEKEGMFMFQHRNYEVKSARRASTVIRRYSDFVWLLDCLHKRYPFRQLPLLPPKRVAGE